MAQIKRELDKENIAYRIQLSDIQARCDREIMFSEISGDTLRRSFAQEIKNLASLERKGRHIHVNH